MNPVRPIQSKEIIILFLLGLFFTTNLLAATAPFIDDMESDTGWTLSPGNNDWQRDAPNPAGNPSPYPPSLPLVHPSRTKCWGTNLSGKYTKNTNSRLTSPQIAMSSAPKPFLSFYSWYKIEAGDYATSEVSTNGTTWNTLETIGQNTPNQGTWMKKVYDLSGYTGTNYTGNIWVRFTLSADNDNATRDLGLYIDDVAVGANYTTQNRYIIAIEPEPTPISTSTMSNNMTVRVEARDLFKYIDNNATDTVTIQADESNPNNSLSGATSSSLSGGKVTFTFADTERETVTFTPSVTVSGQSLTSISSTGRFLSPFKKLWKEEE